MTLLTLIFLISLYLSWFFATWLIAIISYFLINGFLIVKFISTDEMTKKNSFGYFALAFFFGLPLCLIAKIVHATIRYWKDLVKIEPKKNKPGRNLSGQVFYLPENIINDKLLPLAIYYKLLKPLSIQ